MKKIRKILSWVLATVGQWALLYYSFQQGKEWTWNVFVFMQWVMAVLYVLYLVSRGANRALGKKVELTERSVPYGLALASDFGLAIYCAAFGHFFIASLTLVQSMLEGLATEDGKDAAAATEAPRRMEL